MAAPGEVICRATGWLPVNPEAVYARVVDPQAFPALFRGFGPVPGIARIEPDGDQRRVVLSDGSSLRERFTDQQPGQRLEYRAEGFGAPLGWWCEAALGIWTFRRVGSGTEVSWQYRFRTAGGWRRWAVRLTVAPFFQLAMADCVNRLTVACAGHHPHK